MKKAKQTLTAALAATLATGVVGSVASATPLDDSFAAGFKAMQKAQTEKTQTAINEARVAINAMPKELDWAKGEFSKQVDMVQQPIYTEIISLIEKGQKEAKQETVNAGRKLLVGVEEAYAKTWSSNFDTIQQTIVKNATDAVAAAAKSQKAEDIEKAEALIAELKTADNADVKKAVEGLEKDLAEKLNGRVVKAEVKNATTIDVTFSKEMDAATIGREDFVVKSGSTVAYVKEVAVSADKKVVTVTLANEMAKGKDYSVTVKGIKDLKGNIIAEKTFEKINYEKKDIASVSFDSLKAVRGAKLKDQLTIKDVDGRNITKETAVTFECVNNAGAVSKDGTISLSAVIGSKLTVRVYAGTTLLAQEELTVSENLATTYVGFTLGRSTAEAYAKITPNNKLQRGKMSTMTLYYKDALGVEKTVNATNFTKIESLTPDVLTIYSTNSVEDKVQLYGKNLGTALVRVQVGEIDQTIEVQVVSEAVADYTVSLQNSIVNLANADVEKTLEFTVNDNAIGLAATANTGARVEYYNVNNGTWVQLPEYAAKAVNGVITLNGQKIRAFAQSKDVQARLITSYNGKLQATAFNMDIQDAANLAGYEAVVQAGVAGDGKVLSTLDQNAQQAKLRVFRLDSNGNRVSEVNSAAITTANFKITGPLGNRFDGNVNLNAVAFPTLGYYTLTVLDLDGRGMNASTNLTITNDSLVVGNRDLVGQTVATGTNLQNAFVWTYAGKTGTTIAAIEATLVSANAGVSAGAITTATTITGTTGQTATFYVGTVTLPDGTKVVINRHVMVTVQ